MPSADLNTKEIRHSLSIQFSNVDVFLISKDQKNHPFLGISKSILEMTEVLRSLNLKVCLVTEGESFQVSELDKDLIQVCIPRSKKLLQSMWSLKLPHPTAAWIVNVLKYVEISGIVIVPIVGLQSAVCRQLSSFEVKRLITLHTPYSHSTPIQALFNRVQKSTLKYGDIVVANSRTVLGKFESTNVANVTVIPHYVKIVKSRSYIHESKEEILRFVWIGALTYRKGADRLIHLVGRNRGKNQIDVVWANAKFSLPYKICLKLLSNFGFVRLHTNLTEEKLFDLIEGSSAIISTSRFESFGMTIVEAGLQGKGLIAILAPGVTETLPTQNAGGTYFRKISELNAFVTSSQKSQLLKLGKESQAYCKTNYGLEKVSLKWKELINSL
jgi:glycosyltransferase involved in cell wall biosynthesis